MLMFCFSSFFPSPTKRPPMLGNTCERQPLSTVRARWPDDKATRISVNRRGAYGSIDRPNDERRRTRRTRYICRRPDTTYQRRTVVYGRCPYCYRMSFLTTTKLHCCEERPSADTEILSAKRRWLNLTMAAFSLSWLLVELSAARNEVNWYSDYLWERPRLTSRTSFEKKSLGLLTVRSCHSLRSWDTIAPICCYPSDAVRTTQTIDYRRCCYAYSPSTIVDRISNIDYYHPRRCTVLLLRTTSRFACS